MVLTCHSKQSLRFKINYALKASIIRLVQSSSYLMIKAERNPDQLKMPTLQIFGKVTSERQQKFPTQDDKFSKMKALINLLLVFLFLHICLQVRISLKALLLSAQKKVSWISTQVNTVSVQQNPRQPPNQRFFKWDNACGHLRAVARFSHERFLQSFDFIIFS